MITLFIFCTQIVINLSKSIYGTNNLMILLPDLYIINCIIIFMPHATHKGHLSPRPTRVSLRLPSTALLFPGLYQLQQRHCILLIKIYIYKAIDPFPLSYFKLFKSISCGQSIIMYVFSLPLNCRFFGVIRLGALYVHSHKFLKAINYNHKFIVSSSAPLFNNFQRSAVLHALRKCLTQSPGSSW